MSDKRLVVFDCEVYKDYFLAAFKSVDNGRTKTFEAWPGQPLDVEGLARTMRNVTSVTFNGNGFDLPLIALALTGASCEDLKIACDDIITNRVRPWTFEQKYRVQIPRSWDSIDIMEVAPGQGSLKIYGGRLHCRRMQDLPIEPSQSISPEQREDLKTYCTNDLDTTIQLYLYLKPQIDLRIAMSAEYDRDLRSKSDAQMAETVIKDKVSGMVGWRVSRPDIPTSTTFKYVAPALVSFRTEALQAVLRMVEEQTFALSESGKVLMPEALAKAAIRIGDGVYRMGIGGLHSSEECAAHVADESHLLEDIDFTSYYPFLILAQGLYPYHLGPQFLGIYKDIVAKRVEAKRRGLTVAAESLKIVVNGSFGKFGSHWSALYSPALLIQTTITGQLLLLMMIEALEGIGVRVVSANTDGIVVRCPRKLESKMRAEIAGIELFTGLETESTRYKAIYSRDVNNYLAFKEAGGHKAKGAYAPAGLQKNPSNVICVEAVVAFIEKGTRIPDTVTGCKDVRKFVTIRKVAGGATKNGVFLGKAIRWYYATGETGTIHYKPKEGQEIGNTVARSEGARPLMELPEDYSLPADIDFGWYTDEAYRILGEVGFRHAPVITE